MDDVIRLVRGLRHPLRWLAYVVAAFALVGGFAGTAGVVAALLGATLGHALGEVGGRLRLRAPVVVAAGGALIVVVVGVRWLLLGTSVFASLIGPSATLSLASFVACGAGAVAIVGMLRALAYRANALRVVEIAALAGAFSVAFAAHRFGAIARPMWLADAAWQLGWDPAEVLLMVGGLFVALLAVIQLGESERRLPVGLALLLPLLGLVAAWLVDPMALAQPDAAELAEVNEGMGEPPKNSSRDGYPVDAGPPEPRKTKSEGRGNRGGDPRDKGVIPEDGPGGDAPREIPAGVDRDGDGKPDLDWAEAPDKDGDGEPDEPPSPKEPASGDSDGQADSDGQDPKDGGEPDEPKDSDGDGQADEPKDSDAKDAPPPKTPPNPEDSGGTGKNRPVAVVILGDDHAPLSDYFYLRQATQSAFNGHRLVASTVPGVDRDLLGHFPLVDEPVVEPPPAEGREVVHGSVSLLAEHELPFALETPVRFGPRKNPNPARFIRSYTFESLALTLPYEQLMVRKVGNPAWSPEVNAEYLTWPKEDARYQALADSLVAKLDPAVREEPFARALVIKSYLDENTKYSKKARHAGVADPTADYLFGNFIGYCVHTSHAAVYLWRAAGIPARVGTGYAVEAARRRGSALVVMGGDAHAWPELYIDGLGWVVLDVNPAVNLDETQMKPVDEEEVDLLAEMAREEAGTEAKRTDWRWVRRALWRGALGLLASVVTGTLLVHWSVKAWRRLRPLVAGRTGLPRVGYRLALDWLSEAGFVRDEGETRERFAARVAAVAPAFGPLTEMHLQATLGAPGSALRRPELDTKRWSRLLIELSLQLARGVPWWRRWFGAVNPISFYWSR